MATNNQTAIFDRVRETAKQLNIGSQRQSLAAGIRHLRERVLSQWSAVQAAPGQTGAFGLESIANVVVERNRNFNPVTDGNPEQLMRGLQDLGMSPRHIEQSTVAVLNLFDKDGYNSQTILRESGSSDDRHLPLSAVIGRTSAAMLMSADSGGAGLEAFGDDVNRLSTDDRLTMDLMIMRPWDNIMDKALARVSDSSPVVTIRIPSPEAWDWASTQNADSTSATRNGSSNTYRLRDLYRNPTPVNSAPKKIVPLVANDSKGAIWNNDVKYFKTGRDVSILDLARDTNRASYDHVDRTDLVSDGGILDGVIIAITDPNGGAPKTENFLLNTRPFDLAMFVITPSNKSSGQRQVILPAVLPISSATKQYNDAASTIAAKLTDAKLRVGLQINATLNIQTGMLQASGSVNLEGKKLDGGADISAPTQTLINGLTAQIVAYSVDLAYDEENQRKANLAVWVQYYEQQFVVPRSRIYFTEYALTQEIDENAIATTSSIVALGNGRRGLGIVVNALNDISTGLAYMAANPEVASSNAIDEQSFAAALVKPTVVTTTLDFGTEELNTMNESTRLSEIHGRFRARFLSMCTTLFAKSLMLNQYRGGETPVIKAWVHSTIADLVIGILDYHPDLQDRESLATGADYSMVLPNGYRLDVIKSNLDCLQQRIYAVPVIESDMASILSAASIRDCGTVTTNYTPSNNGAVTRRVATTSREIVMMSNKVGLCLKVIGLSTQLGPQGYDTIALSADHSDSLAI